MILTDGQRSALAAFLHAHLRGYSETGNPHQFRLFGMYMDLLLQNSRIVLLSDQTISGTEESFTLS